MGGKSGGNNFSDVAAAQGEENRESVRDQLYANRPTQYTPWGYTNWTNEQVDDGHGGLTDKWSQTSGLTPELQDILDKQIAIQGGRSDVAGMLTGRMGSEFGNQMDWSALSPMGQVPTSQFTLPEGGINDPYQTRQAAEDSVYNQAKSRLEPQYDSKRQALEIKMRNQGVGPEDEAWKSQMETLNNQETDAYNQAQWSANQAGRAESGQMFGQQLGLNQNTYNQALNSNQQNFGQAMQGSQYANQIRQQQMTEQMQKRGFSLNEINALLSGQQVGMPQMPNFSGAQAAQPAPLYQGAADAASVANAANPLPALMGMGGDIIGGALAGR